MLPNSPSCCHQYERLLDCPFDAADYIECLPDRASNFRYWFVVCLLCFNTAEVAVFDLPGNNMGMQAVTIDDWQEITEDDPIG